jgi:hypothetical protein
MSLVHILESCGVKGNENGERNVVEFHVLYGRVAGIKQNSENRQRRLGLGSQLLPLWRGCPAKRDEID